MTDSVSAPVQPLQRQFKFDGQMLEDPNPKLTPEQVKEFYAPRHPELTTAGIGSPVTDLVKGTVTVEFIKSYGRKG